ncbi:MAG TPA: phenylalanine--tRNA ligase subunit beta, partial [Candidatus Marinimicrobia bacterium]|nr:phenylalanine--tRNA ligase subunit beta [Candidatus Neomarinimicrobiota bacterium]
MKVSLNWLKDYLDVSGTAEEISDTLTALGLEASYEITGKSFTGIVLGKVIECGPHENADKLSVCEVDIGDEENYTIVCGAPNVKSGIHVPVAKVGATLNNGDFKIKQAKLRGVESSGMICSERELAISDEHEGIMILDTKAEIGTPIEEILTFKEDTLFEIDLTPNRGDCLSHLGVARELGIGAGVDVKRRAVDLIESANSTSNEIKVSIADSDACPRYAARVVTGVKVRPSPQWLVDRMTSIGQSSINNIVDAANYVLMDFGHPMHTFDLDNISGNEINVRYAKKGEKLTTLDNEKRDLKDFHLLICDGDKPIALAGIMGGINSEINDGTTNILIESAYFSPTVVRKGAKVLDLSTEASRRFERDTDMDGIIPAINQLATLIVEVAGGEICKGVVDEYPAEKMQRTIDFSIEKCEALLGTHIPKDKIENIFVSLQITHTKQNGSFQCIIPSFRNDLEREVDLYEEVARVIGYDNIPSSAQFTGSYNSFVKDDQKLDSLLRTQLQANGFHEHYSNSLQHEKDTLHFTGGDAVQLKNPL